MNENISIDALLKHASRLKSEEGENPEYDRALVELCIDAAGASMEDKMEMAEKIGIINFKP